MRYFHLEETNLMIGALQFIFWRQMNLVPFRQIVKYDNGIVVKYNQVKTEDA